MGQAISTVVGKGGNTVEPIGSQDSEMAATGDIVILAVPYPALQGILAARSEQLAGKIVVDITNRREHHPGAHRRGRRRR